MHTRILCFNPFKFGAPSPSNPELKKNHPRTGRRPSSSLSRFARAARPGRETSRFGLATSRKPTPLITYLWATLDTARMSRRLIWADDKIMAAGRRQDALWPPFMVGYFIHSVALVYSREGKWHICFQSSCVCPDLTALRWETEFTWDF